MGGASGLWGASRICEHVKDDNGARLWCTGIAAAKRRPSVALATAEAPPHSIVSDTVGTPYTCAELIDD